jgi:hypothetical protein
MRQMMIIIVLMIAAVGSMADTQTDQRLKEIENTPGITHYGMAIDEIVKVYRQETGSLEIVYSKELSDDNMDDYVKRFYDELLRQIQKWLYENKLTVQKTKIVISNCKFCKIGYCKKKNIKEIRLDSYRNNNACRHIIIKHIDILDREKYDDIARSAVTIFLEK